MNSLIFGEVHWETKIPKKTNQQTKRQEKEGKQRTASFPILRNISARYLNAFNEFFCISTFGMILNAIGSYTARENRFVKNHWNTF